MSIIGCHKFGLFCSLVYPFVNLTRLFFKLQLVSQINLTLTIFPFTIFPAAFFSLPNKA
jgi:hypothetical protein